MLSKHPESCRFPHGHTRQIEVVVSSHALNEYDMVVDFKALSLAIGGYVQRYDHAMALNSHDPLVADLKRIYPESALVFEGVDPTTEVMAKEIFDHVARLFNEGCSSESSSGTIYTISPGAIVLERVRVWETPSSWAEYSSD
jgi:6-pyruvoyltetrahydropterin/6-carboxytetrahydropterin synthase